MYHSHRFQLLPEPTGQAPQHRDAHGLGRAPNAWSRLGEKKEGEEDGKDESGTKGIVRSLMLGVAAVGIAAMVWAKVRKS
jgi:hypothetical protein